MFAARLLRPQPGAGGALATAILDLGAANEIFVHR